MGGNNFYKTSSFKILGIPKGVTAEGAGWAQNQLTDNKH